MEYNYPEGSNWWARALYRGTHSPIVHGTPIVNPALWGEEPYKVVTVNRPSIASFVTGMGLGGILITAGVLYFALK